MRIVVDTSVARAAGTGRADAGPPSPACSAALLAIQRSSLAVAFNHGLKQEWDRHARPFAKKWLGNLIATKRFARVNEDWDQAPALLDASSALPGQLPAEVAKDVHIVGLAMVTEQRALSLDTRQRALLRPLVAAVPALGALCWVSPTDPGAEAWLAEGAPHDPARRLDAPGS